MTKHLNLLNFALLLLVGGLCVFQWSRERDYGRRLTDLQRTSISQQDKLAEQADAIQRANEDINGFRQQVTELKGQTDEEAVQIRGQKAQIFTLQGEKDKLGRELASWQQALDGYKKAVAARDENIRTLLDQREKLVAANKDAAGKANQAVVAYNDLATKYGDLVGRYNTLATRYKAEQAAGQTDQSKQ